MNMMTTPAADYAAIKTKQNAAWASGDYAKIGVTLQIVGEELAEAVNPAPDSAVLDVAAGNGNATLAFARRWCKVTSTDYVGSLLEQGHARAAAEALDVTFKVADAEALPFKDETFDAVVSTFGVMFAPNQAQAAREMIRVCRRGGKIGMANWTPDSFVGRLFKAMGKRLPPPAGVKSPMMWGNEEWIRETFAGHQVRITQKSFVMRYRSPTHFVDFFRTFYGPVHKAFLALDKTAQAALETDLHATIATLNTASDSSMRVASDYAEVVITKA